MALAGDCHRDLFASAFLPVGNRKWVAFFSLLDKTSSEILMALHVMGV